MFTQSMPAMFQALAGVLPQGAIKQLTQALGNCNQPLTHRAGVNLQPSQFLRNQGLAPTGTWNPNDYGNLLPSINQITNNNSIDLPDFNAGDWNSYNYAGDNFSFPLDQTFTNNNYFGGPTFNVGGNVFFDNTQTTNLTTQDVTTNNINVRSINNKDITQQFITNQFITGDDSGIDMPMPAWVAWWWRRVALAEELRIPQHTHDAKILTYAKEGISKISGVVHVPIITGLMGSLEMPVDSIRGGTVAITGFPTDAISGGTVAITGIPENAIAQGLVTIQGLPANAISGGTVAITGIPTNAISGGEVLVPYDAISGGTVSVTGIPTNAISGGTVSVSLTTATATVFHATGVTFNPETCAVTLQGTNVSVITSVSVHSATVNGVAAAATTRTPSIAGTAAAQAVRAVLTTGFLASTATRTATINGTAAAATTQSVTLTGSTAAWVTRTSPVYGVIAAATTLVCTLTPDTANFDVVGVTVSSTTQATSFALTLQTTAAATATTVLAGSSRVISPFVKTVLAPGGQ